MTCKKEEDLKSFEIAWSFHRNTSRWTHNAMTSSGQDDVPEPGKENAGLPFTKLPEPSRIAVGLNDLIAERCSCRDFSRAPLAATHLSTLVHHALGVWGQDYWGTMEFLERPVPSGGGMYPLELYLMIRSSDGIEPGIYHYVPLLQGLELVRDVRVPESLLSYLFMGQYFVTCASTIMVITAEVRRSMKKYGDRGYRYLLLEAGHVAQNINLVSTGLGLQSLNIGGFFDDELAQLCGLERDKEIVLYAVAVGHGATASKHALRFPSDSAGTHTV